MSPAFKKPDRRELNLVQIQVILDAKGLFTVGEALHGINIIKVDCNFGISWKPIPRIWEVCPFTPRWPFAVATSQHLSTCYNTSQHSPQVLCPWWDLVSSGSLQLLTVVALMALSIDVVTKFGTAVKCTPLNGTIGFGGSQQVRVMAVILLVPCYHRKTLKGPANNEYVLKTMSIKL